MDARITTFRIAAGTSGDGTEEDLRHRLGVISAALSREPGHVAGYAVRTGSETLVLLNLFAGADAAEAGLRAVGPLLASAAADGLRLVGTAAGPAHDVRWSIS